MRSPLGGATASMPITAGAGCCCARAASGHVAALPRRVMNSRRRMSWPLTADNLAHHRTASAPVHRGGRSLSGGGGRSPMEGSSTPPQGVSKPPRRSGLMCHRKCSPVRRVITGGDQRRHGSGLPQSPDVGRVRRHFRFVPMQTHALQQISSLFDHPSSARRAASRHVETKRLHGLEIKLRLIPLACLRGREASWVE